MQKLLFNLGFMCLFMTAMLKGAVVFGAVVASPSPHSFCDGNDPCEARSAKAGDPSQAECTTGGNPCTYTGPVLGVKCHCDFQPGSTKICKCYTY